MKTPVTVLASALACFCALKAVADIAAVVSTHFEKGGQCLHLNCFDSKTLREDMGPWFDFKCYSDELRERYLRDALTAE